MRFALRYLRDYLNRKDNEKDVKNYFDCITIHYQL